MCHPNEAAHIVLSTFLIIASVIVFAASVAAVTQMDVQASTDSYYLSLMHLIDAIHPNLYIVLFLLTL